MITIWPWLYLFWLGSLTHRIGIGVTKGFDWWRKLPASFLSTGCLQISTQLYLLWAIGNPAWHFTTRQRFQWQTNAAHTSKLVVHEELSTLCHAHICPTVASLPMIDRIFESLTCWTTGINLNPCCVLPSKVFLFILQCNFQSLEINKILFLMLMIPWHLNSQNAAI